MLDAEDQRIAALPVDQLRALVASTPAVLRPQLIARLERIKADRAADGQRLVDRADPVGWCTRALGDHLWSKQRAILEALKTHQRVAVPACHGPGKSFLASRAIAHAITTSPADEIIVVTTAPTGDQVRAILWKEIGLAHSKGKLPGRIVHTTQWKVEFDGGDVLVGMGRKPADHDTAAFQGIHALRQLVVLDEADGIPAQFWDAAESLITTKEARILAIGNPDDPSSYFAKILDPTKPESFGWHVERISAFDLPAYTGEEIPESVSAKITGREWVEDKRRRWGESSPLWSSKVLAVHPKNAADAAVPWSRIAVARTPRQLDHLEENDDHVLGVDVGGGGDDTVVCERRGWRVASEEVRSTPEPEDVAKFVIERLAATGARTVQIDSGGIGWGVVGMLRAARAAGEHDAEIVPVNAGSSPTHEPLPGEPKLANMRSQLWWWAREHVAEWDLTGCAEDTLAELAAPKWSVKLGKIVVESKDELRKRIGKSPDSADALLLCFVDLGPGPVGVATAEDVTAADDENGQPSRLVVAGFGYGSGRV
jgi:hypothetical protein